MRLVLRGIGRVPIQPCRKLRDPFVKKLFEGGSAPVGRGGAPKRCALSHVRPTPLGGPSFRSRRFLSPRGAHVTKGGRNIGQIAATLRSAYKKCVIRRQTI